MSSRRIFLVALSLCVVPLAAWSTGTIDEVAYKTKDGDGNLWSERYRSGRLMRGHCARRRCLAFTFDDGPAFETTPRLLDTLDQRGLRVTFFVTGHRMDGDGEVARRNREVLRAAWSRGHLIGNHTYHHDLMDSMSDETLRYEIDRTEALITGVTGQRSYVLRAPFGALNHPRAVRAVFSRGYTPVHWALDSNDWRVNRADAVLANVRAELDRSPRGGVMLMHDTLPWTVEAFPRVLDEIDRRNRELVARGEDPYLIVGLDAFYERWDGGAGARRRRRPRR
ncbi:MAG: polysaccharide deacetylase family protein [Polyangiales bacterium]